MSENEAKYAPQNTTELLDLVRGKLDEHEFKAVADVFNRNVVALGEHESFALRDSEGDIRAYKQRARLSSADGTLVRIGPVWTVSAQGYEILAEATGTLAIFPPMVQVSGQMLPNPHPRRDGRNGRILDVTCRAVAFRFSSKGIPMVVDWTSVYDVVAYRMIDLIGKAKEYPQAFRLLPKDDGKPGDKGTWAMYPFDESSDLWVNTSHDEALKWYGEILNREKKSMDFAQTFARRNAIKHLLGIQKMPKGIGRTWGEGKHEQAQWDVACLCWRPVSGSVIKWDMTQYAQLQQRVDKIVSGSAGFIDRPRIASGFEHAGDDGETGDADLNPEEPADLQDFVDVDHKDVPSEAPAVDAPRGTAAPKNGPSQAPEPAPAQAKKQASPRPAKGGEKERAPEYTREELAVMNNYYFVQGEFPELHARALKELKIAEQITPELAAKINHKISQYVDEGEL